MTNKSAFEDYLIAAALIDAIPGGFFAFRRGGETPFLHSLVAYSLSLVVSWLSQFLHSNFE